MGWNGAGVVIRYTPVASGATAWADTKAAGDVNITTADHDYHDQNLAAAIQNTIAKDGQNYPTANLPMNGQKHTGVAVAVAATDYARFDQVLKLTGGTLSGPLTLTAALTGTSASFSSGIGATTGTFSGAVTSPTNATADNSTQLANSNWVRNQFTRAIGANESSFTVNNSNLIYKFGRNSTSAGTFVNTFVTPFPNALISVVATTALSAGTIGHSSALYVSSQSASAFTIYTDSGLDQAFNWIAIGY